MDEILGRVTGLGLVTPIGGGFAINALHLREAAILFLFLAQRLQRAAPGDDLVKHGGDRLLMLGTRLEDAEVFKVGKHGEQDVVAHRGDLHLGHDQA